MTSSSRTAKSVKNSIIALGFYLINLGLQFFARKIFLEYLGTEILGLNTTAMNLLQFLNLAELGINSAVGFTLYKPLHDNERDTINEIVTLQGHLYRRIAYLIMIGAAILMCFFPIIFKKITLPLWYAYVSFGVLLFSALLGYFYNYRQIVLSANQQDYKILYSYKSVMLVKVAFQIFAVYSLPNGYVWWLVLEAFFSIIATITLRWMTNRTFPYLHDTRHSFKELRLKYPEFTIKIKQLFFHKIGTFAMTQTSPLIIYAYASLTLVALYGNYMMVIMGLQLLVTSLFTSINASVGNLVVEGDKDRIYRVFEELFYSRFIISVTLCFCAYLLIPEFITIWIGKEYLLETTTLALLILFLFIQTFRLSIESFTNAYGLFGDIWAPIVEATLNIGLSILLGFYWGLNGIILGVIISLIVIVICWKAYYLFTRAMKNFMSVFFKIYCKSIIIGIISVIISYHIYSYFRLSDNSWLDLCGNIVICSFSCLSILLLIFSLTCKLAKNLLVRIITLFHF